MSRYLIILFFLGCSPKPIIITKPILVKPIYYPIPIRPEIRLLDPTKELYETENFRSLTYNIVDSETYIKDLLEVILYYESYSDKKDSKSDGKTNGKEKDPKDN